MAKFNGFVAQTCVGLTLMDLSIHYFKAEGADSASDLTFCGLLSHVSSKAHVQTTEVCKVSCYNWLVC